MSEIEKLRNKFLQIYNEYPDQFDNNDVIRIRDNEWSVNRFLLLNRLEKKALKALIEAMKWRKTFGVNQLSDQYFPEEFYKMGLFNQFGCDKEGRQLLWWSGSKYYTLSHMKTWIQEFAVYQFERLDRENEYQSWAIVFDPIGMSLSNVDIDYILFISKVLQNYYPMGIAYMLVLDIPWILYTSACFVLKFLNEDMKNLAKFVKKDKLTKHIDIDSIPQHLNGNYKNIIRIPFGVKPIHLLNDNRFSDKQIEKFRSTLG